MKTTENQNSTSSSKSTKPFFNKGGEGTFFAQKQEADAPFFQPKLIQTALAVGAPNDPFEQEADKVGRQVMDNFGQASNIQAKLSNLGVQTSIIQPMPIGTRISRMVQHRQKMAQAKCDNCKEEEMMAQPKSMGIQFAGEGGLVSSNIEQRINSHRGGGSSMDAQTKAAMESSFGSDFSSVNIHTGTSAVQMSQELNAHAFTVGNDIFFNKGRYQPQTKQGAGLLAHELTHTVQQGAAVQNKRINRRPLSQMLAKHEMAHLSSMDTNTLSRKEMAQLERMPEEEMMQQKEIFESKEVDKIQKKDSGLSLRRCGGGTPPAAPITTVSIADVNAANTPAPVKRIIPRKNTAVNVTVAGATTASPVILSIDGGSAANGTATINGGATHTLTSTESVNLKGGTQTSPGNANKLKLVAKQGTSQLATSNPFSVAAYPTVIGFNFNRLVEGEILFPPNMDWGAAYDVEFTSDSGVPGDCDKTKVSENIILDSATGIFVGAISNTSDFLKTTDPQRDHHTVGVPNAATMKRVIDGADLTSTNIVNQFFRFSCKRTDVNKAEDKTTGPKVPTSGFKISKTISKYFIHVKKEGFANNSVAAGAVDDPAVKNAKVT